MKIKNSLIIVVGLGFACFAFPPQARAVCQDGCLTNFNTAQGDDALISDTTGNSNAAFGIDALFSNTTGNANTATGAAALYSNIGGDVINMVGNYNTADGFEALYYNTTGEGNTASGSAAMLLNSSGYFNTATGYNALYSNTTGYYNMADGAFALDSNTKGINNTASGYSALLHNTTGNYNTASGQGALSSNTVGTNNAALGQNALVKNTTGSDNVAVGSNAGFALTTGSNNIEIGNRGLSGDSQTIRIGKSQTATFVAGINGATVPTGVGVIIDASGHLGTVTSSARFKDAIQPMDKTSEAIFSLRPVTFRYKKEWDPKAVPQFGLVAEQVEKVDPDLVARDDQNRPYSVRYEAVNAMLLNEFLKEHRKNEGEHATIEKQEKRIEALELALKEQATEIQKIGAKLEANQANTKLAGN
jgi:hypothetical protein